MNVPLCFLKREQMQPHESFSFTNTQDKQTGVKFNKIPVGACVCVCLCVCECEREEGRKRESVCNCVSVCLSVCLSASLLTTAFQGPCHYCDSGICISQQKCFHHSR